MLTGFSYIFSTQTRESFPLSLGKKKKKKANRYISKKSVYPCLYIFILLCFDGPLMLNESRGNIKHTQIVLSPVSRSLVLVENVLCTPQAARLELTSPPPPPADLPLALSFSHR